MLVSMFVNSNSKQHTIISSIHLLTIHLHRYFHQHICDQLSENLTCLQLHFMTFYCLEGNQWAVVVSALFGKSSWSYTDRQQEEQNNRFVQSLYRNKITGVCLIYHKSRVQWATELGLVSFCSP